MTAQSRLVVTPGTWSRGHTGGLPLQLTQGPRPRGKDAFPAGRDAQAPWGAAGRRLRPRKMPAWAMREEMAGDGGE